MSGARRRPVRSLVLAGLGISLLLGVGLSALASSEPDGLEAAFLRAECAEASDEDACLEEAAGEPVFAAAPLPDYEISWLSGAVGVALCFALGAGLVLLVRGRRGGAHDGPTPAPSATREPKERP